jgi:cyclic pyranopterin phosphate synthase
LFATQGYDLKELIRDESQPEKLSAAIANIWTQREDRYSQLRDIEPPQLNALGENSSKRKVEMSYIGG